MHLVKRDVPAWVRLLAGVTAIRLAAAISVPVVPEEAYHWNYARHLDWSYHDHPPMIAWAIAAGRLLFGDTRLAIRLVPLLFATGTTVLLARLARRLFGDHAATWAVLLVSVQPITFFMLGFGYPDAPLAFFWALALTWVLNALGSGRAVWWLAAGTALGGAMLSKYTAVFLGLAVLVHLVCSERDRKWLATPWPYLSGAITIAVFSPVLFWNAGHGWASFEYQSVAKFERVQGVSLWLGLKFLGGQLLTTLPLTLPLAIVGVSQGFRSPRPADRLLAWSFAPMFAFFFLLGWTRSIHPQWPLPAYLGLIVLMAGAVARSERGLAAFYRRCRTWLAALAAVGWLGLVAHAAFPLPGIAPLKGLYGWQAVAAKAAKVRATLPPGSFYIAVGRRYTVTSELAYHLQAPYEVHGKGLLGVDELQYDYWDQPDGLWGGDAVVVIEVEDWGDAALALLRQRFRAVEPVGELVMAVERPRRVRKPPPTFAFYVGRGYNRPD